MSLVQEGKEQVLPLPQPSSCNVTLLQYTDQYLPSCVFPSMCTLLKFKLVFFVPPSALDACKGAVFAAGAGQYPGTGGYTECCFTTKGTGQFRPGGAADPLASHPFITLVMRWAIEEPLVQC
jgi:hypothetical protein